MFAQKSKKIFEWKKKNYFVLIFSRQLFEVFILIEIQLFY
jgi:hypothetical protein